MPFVDCVNSDGDVIHINVDHVICIKEAPHRNALHVICTNGTLHTIRPTTEHDQDVLICFYQAWGDGE